MSNRYDDYMNGIAQGETPEFNPVSKPKHYNSHPSGIECIQVTEHMDFLIGNAIKYLWRTEHKNGIEDLKKAIWYIERKIALLEKSNEH
jgi:hypothetical protein